MIQEVKLNDIISVGADCGYKVDEVNRQSEYVLFEPGSRFHRAFYVGEKATLYLQDYYFDDTELIDRTEFDRHFYKLMIELNGHLGKETGRITFVPRHRKYPHYYNAAYWDLDRAYIILTQDEFDIQFGLDVSIRVYWGRGDIVSIIELLGSA